MAHSTESTFGVLKEREKETGRNQAISQLCTDYFYVSTDVLIADLADDLNHVDEISAVGVVDQDHRAVGIIVRNELFSLLGRPYGRDVLSRLPVTEVMQQSPVVRADSNVFSVAEELDEYLKSSDVSYFALTDDAGRFKGIFSTHDMLLYLSEMTQRDIALARKLQSRLVHERDLVVGKTFEFSSYSASAKGVGGDFYTVFPVEENRWVMSVCDVSGKGVSASILTSAIWGMMSIYDFRAGIQPFVQRLNEYIANTFESEKFVTGLFLSYNETKGVVQLCDMGHSHIFIFRKGKLMRVSTNQRNLPLGVSPSIDPKVSRFTPKKDDILVVVTDGLLEQESESGDVYSLDRVVEILRKHENQAVEILNDRIIDDFETFRGSHHLNDDVTYAIMKFRKQEVVL